MAGAAELIWIKCGEVRPETLRLCHSISATWNLSTIFSA